MFNLFELDKILEEQLTVYRDVREYAYGEKQYPTSPYMQEYYKGLLLELAVKLNIIKKEIIKLEKSMGVKS